MPIELFLLVCSAILGLAHVLLAGMITTGTFGLHYGAGPRDEEKKPGKIGGRVQRAFRNFMETFPFFAAAILIAAVLDRHNEMTGNGAKLYFGARLVYLPLYAAGIPVVRSAVWLLSVIGIFMILLGVLQ